MDYNLQKYCESLCCTPVWRKQWHPTPVLLPGESHGRRSLVSYSPWGREESDMTEWLHFHFHALEKEMATHSSVLAWRIPGTGEPGGLLSTGLHRVGLKRLSSSSTSTICQLKKKELGNKYRSHLLRFNYKIST